MSIAIRHLSESPDAAAMVARWHWDEWGPFSPDGTFEGLQRRLVSWVNLDKPPMMLVAFADESPVGSVSLVDHDMEQPPPEVAALSPWLSGLFVLPSMRGRGIGALLVRACEGHAARTAGRKVFLHTKHARCFYERLGWNLRLETHYDGGVVAVMERSPDTN